MHLAFGTDGSEGQVAEVEMTHLGGSRDQPSESKRWEIVGDLTRG